MPGAKSSLVRKSVILLLLLLAITLAWKVTIYIRPSDDSQEAGAYRSVAEFLGRQHFNVTVAEKPEEGGLSIRATAGHCRLLIAKAAPNGSDRDRIWGHATPTDTVFVIYRGRVYAEQPVWAAVADSIWFKFLRELGLRPQLMPVFIVIATRGCGAEQLPWGNAL